MVLLDQLFCDKIFVKIPLSIQIVWKYISENAFWVKYQSLAPSDMYALHFMIFFRGELQWAALNFQRAQSQLHKISELEFSCNFFSYFSFPVPIRSMMIRLGLFKTHVILGRAYFRNMLIQSLHEIFGTFFQIYKYMACKSIL